MADQSNLTIKKVDTSYVCVGGTADGDAVTDSTTKFACLNGGGVVISEQTGNDNGGDPSGSHPIGQLNDIWGESVDDASVKYTVAAGKSLFEGVTVEALGAGEEAYYYSKPLSVSLIPGLMVDIGNTGNAECEAAIQWYNSKDDFVSGAPGPGDGTNSPSNSEGGTWTTWHSLAQNYSATAVTPSEDTDDSMMHKGSLIRVIVHVDDGGGGVTVGDIETYLATVSDGTEVWVPIDMEAEYNTGISITTAGESGGDPS